MPTTDDRFSRSLNHWWSRQLADADASPGAAGTGEGGAAEGSSGEGGAGATGADAGTGGTGAIGGDWRRGRSVEALAAELRRDVPFEVAQARLLHRRPDRDAALAAVARLEPPPSEAEREVLADAVVRAGASARTVRMTTAGAMLTVLALVVRNVLRGR